jgi:hypothetical protein
MADKTELEERVQALEKRLAEALTRLDPPKPKPFKSEPYERYDPTAGATMPPSAQKAMLDAMPDWLMRCIREEDRAPKASPSLAGVSAGGEDRAPVVASRHDRGR